MSNKIIDGIKAIGKIYEIDNKVDRIQKLIPNPTLSFEVHLAEHCNLNCKGCDNFSSIANPSFVNTDSLCNDFKRLSLLTNSNAKRIHLLGGEPLLHPEKEKIMISAREYFPDAMINIYTNGILLEKQNDNFWSICRDSKINILVTRYPINLNYNKILEIANDKGVNMSFCNSEKESKKLFRITMDTEGQQDEKGSFLKCHRANTCITLKNGKMYTCTTIPNIEHYNKQFNENLHVTEDDYIDIYKVSSYKEISEFLCKPMPFCRYCAVDYDKKMYDWEISKKDKSEWTK